MSIFGLAFTSYFYRPYRWSLSMITTLVNQRYNPDGSQRSDCLLACLAMAVNTLYEDLFDAQFIEKFSGGAPEWKDFESAFERVDLVDGVNMAKVYIHGFTDYSKIRRLLKWRRAILQVPSLNIEGGEHVVYWDGERLYDPSNFLQYRWLDQLFPTSIWVLK